MFTKINEAEVHSSQGYKIKYGRDSLTYSEGDRYLAIPIEHLGAPYEMAIYLRSAGAWQQRGRAGGFPTDDEKHEVSQRIEDGLRFLGRRFSIKE